MPAVANEKGPTIQIRLREPKWVDQIALVVGLIMVISGLVDLAYEGFVSGAGFTPLVGFFITWYGFRQLRQGVCGLELSDRGILLRSYSLGPFTLEHLGGYYCAGVTPWGNLKDAGVVKGQMTQCFGLRVSDLRLFLNRRNQLADEQTLEYIAANKVSVKPVTRLFRDLTGKLGGYTKLPQPNDEIAILEWNLENYGYHIVCVGRPPWFFGRPYRGGPKKIAEVIDERARIHR